MLIEKDRRNAEWGMGAKIINGNSRPASSNGTTTQAAKVLIRKLMAQTATVAAPVTEGVAEGETPGVLFCAEVDGVRCMLMKAPPRTTPEVWLSPREKEIARMVAKGYPNKAIADVLDISVWTVSTHLRHIFAKLGVNSRAAMVARTSSLGMLA